MLHPHMSARDHHIEILKSELPYGIWTCADGREVLFNRRYQPILERASREQPARPANPREWVLFQKQHWFYDSYSRPPWLSAATRRHCEAILREWGIVIFPGWGRPVRTRSVYSGSADHSAARERDVAKCGVEEQGARTALKLRVA